MLVSATGGLGSDRDSETAAFVNLARRGSVSSGTPKTRGEERVKLSVHGICPVGQSASFFTVITFIVLTLHMMITHYDHLAHMMLYITHTVIICVLGFFWFAVFDAYYKFSSLEVLQCG